MLPQTPYRSISLIKARMKFHPHKSKECHNFKIMEALIIAPLQVPKKKSDRPSTQPHPTSPYRSNEIYMVDLGEQ